MNFAVSIQGINKTFGEGNSTIHVANNLDFTLQAGKFEAIMGPSGSGKSTLLHLIAGLLTADAGTIHVGGQEITSMNDHDMTIFRRQNIGLIFQDFNLVPTLTAEENITLPLLLDRKKGVDTQIQSLVKSLGLTNRLHHLPSKLSGGERQRVAIARAIAGNPTVVLADEPTGNLDSPAAQDFCKLMRKLNQETNCAILMVTHDAVTAAAADKIHMLRDGRFVDSFETDHNPERVSQRYLESLRLSIKN